MDELFATTLDHEQFPERKLTISANKLGHSEDVQLGFVDLHTRFNMYFVVNVNDIQNGIARILANDGTVSMSNRRLVINTEGGLELSWLLDGWVGGEEAMVALVDWLRKRVGVAS